MLNRLFCLVQPLVDDDYDPAMSSRPQRSIAGAAAAASATPPNSTASGFFVPRFPLPSLYDTRVVLHGRLSLLCRELEDLQDQLKRLPRAFDSHRLLSKRLVHCSKIVTSLRTSVHVIDAAARHQREPSHYVLMPISDVFGLGESELCEYAHNIADVIGQQDLDDDGDADDLAENEISVSEDPAITLIAAAAVGSSDAPGGGAAAAARTD